MWSVIEMERDVYMDVTNHPLNKGLKSVEILGNSWGQNAMITYLIMLQFNTYCDTVAGVVCTKRWFSLTITFHGIE